MRFVDSKQGNTDGLQCFEKPAATKTLGRHVDQLELTAPDGVDAKPLLSFINGTVDEAIFKN